MEPLPTSQGLEVEPPKKGGVGRWWMGVVGLMMLAAGVGIVWMNRVRPPELPVMAPAALELVDGRLMVRGATNQAFTGWMAEQHQDGGLKSHSKVVNGLLSGVSEGWYTNGMVQVREHFVDGVAEGPVVKWYADGTRLSEGTARGGKLEGVFKRWHPNGKLAEEVMLKDGQAHGLSRAWFPSGDLKAEVEMDGGQVVKQQFWKDGQGVGITAASGTQATP